MSEPVINAFEQQFINDTLDQMRKLNEKYASFYHFKVLTVVPMEKDKCSDCTQAKCLRLVVEGHELTSDNSSEE